MHSLTVVRHLPNSANRCRLAYVQSNAIRTVCSNLKRQPSRPVTFNAQNIKLISSHKFSQTCAQANQIDPQRSASSDFNPYLSLPPHVDAKLSYAYGRSTKELRYCTLAPMIEAMAQREPHSTAVVVYDEGICKSFEDLNNDVNKLVSGMVHNLGLSRGDNVGIYSYNNYQFILIQFACCKLGLKMNPINPSYKSHEFSYVLGKADAKVLFMPGKNSKQSSLNDHWSVICDKSIKDIQSQGKLSSLKHLVLLDGDSNHDFCLQNIEVKRWRQVYMNNGQLDAKSQAIIDQVQSDDIYGIYYTSGTTGFPKGAAITHYNVINNVALSCDRLFTQRGPNYKAIRPNICLPLPLFHEFAGVLGVLSPFMGGGSFVLTGMRYSIQSVVESIMRFKCNAIFLTPTILIDFLSYVEREKVSNIPIKTLLIAGSAVMSELVYKARKTLPNLEEFRIGYGSSENGVISTIQTSQETVDNQPYTVGPPLDFTEIRIADTNTGETTLLGQSGEVQTRGFNTMLCYYQDDDKTKEVITKSRWYKTGDLGIIDKHGSLQIVGRIKDLIIKGGENIYPKEIETVLHTHEAIEDAHVIGVPDKRFGEEVCVWVKLKERNKKFDESEMKESIIDFCKRKLTYFKVPKYVIFVDEFPLTPVKKIKKFEMRAQTAKMLHLD